MTGLGSACSESEIELQRARDRFDQRFNKANMALDYLRISDGGIGPQRSELIKAAESVLLKFLQGD